MDFPGNKPIYLQIADHFCSRILDKTWNPGDRIPSVRDVAVKMEVNPNTAMRAFHFLQEQDILYNRRGVGYFVHENAYQQVLKIKRREFLEEKLPVCFKEMEQLGFSFSDLKKLYNQYK